MTLPRALVNACMDHARAYDLLGPDAHAARETVMSAAETSIARILASYGVEVAAVEPSPKRIDKTP